jgi:anti-anti-sigma factor
VTKEAAGLQFISIQAGRQTSSISDALRKILGAAITRNLRTITKISKKIVYRFVSSRKESAMPATIATIGNIAQIGLMGDFDFSNQDELRLAFEQVISAPGTEIEIDMRMTSFIDSSVIRMFLKLRDMAERSNKSLTIVNCSERITEIFAIGGFDQIFDIR